MRVIVVNKMGVRFHSGMLEEVSKESYCSCARVKSPRDVVWREGSVFITLPNKEYASIILRKTGTKEKPIHQRNPEGVSIFTTEQFMVMVRFATSYQSAIQFLQKQNSLPSEEDKYIVSTTKIEKAQEEPQPKDENLIFVYESSFGDVFSDNPLRENYTGEQTSADTQMYSRLKRSSYSSLDGSYPLCWT